ncbi:hypothetical protein RHECNPAF_9300103 [Rhizobium etli CNPAF512]|nr:hypothetical protein RHECNPAF_9300103 [Rhizobium etli CNPAF512]
MQISIQIIGRKPMASGTCRRRPESAVRRQDVACLGATRQRPNRLFS